MNNLYLYNFKYLLKHIDKLSCFINFKFYFNNYFFFFLFLSRGNYEILCKIIKKNFLRSSFYIVKNSNEKILLYRRSVWKAIETKSFNLFQIQRNLHIIPLEKMPNKWLIQKLRYFLN